jgi:hypothetical protein
VVLIDHLHPLGMAQYRTGKFREAVETLVSTNAVYNFGRRSAVATTVVGLLGSPLGQGPLLGAHELVSARAFSGMDHAPNLAFLAMAHHQLGDKDQAQALLERLRVLAKFPYWQNRPDAQAFWREAEALLAAPRKALPRGDRP